MSSSGSSGGTSIGMILFIVFRVLKLCKVIDWSWWWVTAPLWIGLAIAGVIGLIALIIVVLSNVVKG
jgi:hypothetical protein